ncbi:oligosaccharide flippase family protein [Mangrovimonas spongiae]|uniref:Flippase n=1 Tax=Mangrovimonas spongiae TaxID=2494697 RepID=A0A428K573_9FLAO|nr:oligosaccharide flippase family protein [Mangrovimonas spongiae]RSK41512.1 flippase [Mangrovimonas spongiae]
MELKQKVRKLFRNNDNKEILNKGFSFFVLRVGGLFAGYLFTYFIAKEYGASEVGLVSLCFTLIMCISIFGRLGIDVNLIPYFSNTQNQDDSGLFLKVLGKAFILSSILALIIFLLKSTISVKLFNKPQLEPYIFWTALTIPLWTVILVCAGLFRSFKKNTLFAFFNNPGRFLATLLALLLFFLYCKDEELIAIKAHFYGVLALAIVSMVLAIKQFKCLELSSKANSWKFIKEAFPMMLSGVIIVFLGWADTFVLGIYETDDTIGVYNVALKIAALTSFSLQAINSILAPKIAKSYQEGDVKQLKEMIKFATNTNFIITVIVVTLIFLTHSFLLGLFGPEFISGATLLFLLCIGQLVNSLSGSVGLIMQMTGLQKVYQNIVLIALLINIILNFILTPKYGAIGAAIATIISMAFWNIYSAIYLKRKKNIISYFKL